MCIRDRALPIQSQVDFTASELLGKPTNESITINVVPASDCLLYTSDAADERSSVDLGGRRIIKKKKNINNRVGRTH